VRIWVGLWLCGVVLGFASPASATFIDLTPGEGSSGTINGVLFEYGNFQSSGTGSWNSFVRLAANGVEEGYNTSGRPVPFDEKTDPNFTRDLRFGLLATVDGSFAFELDINESNSPRKSKISLDGLRIYISATGGQTTTDLDSLGTLLYDLDAGGDSTVLLDHRNDPGSGKADMLMLVPTSIFAGVADSDFVYLYSRFGELASADANSDAGFEEWRAFVVPEPGTFALLGFGLLLVANRRRRGLPRARA
jgi:hypothetical protein